MFVGRLAPEKGVHLLLEAFAQVSASHPDARLELIGPQDLSPKQFVDPFGRDPLIDQISEFYQSPDSFRAKLAAIAQPLGPRVSFRGPIPNDVMEGELARAGIFVFASLWEEPFGIPVIEAMAAGLPVVVTRSGALPEIVEHGVTGIVVPRGDVTALANAIGGRSPIRRNERPWVGRRAIGPAADTAGTNASGDCWSSTKPREPALAAE